MEDWPFDQAPNVACITSVNVLNRTHHILQVCHFADDHSWGFTCGLTNKEEDARIIGMGEALERDPTLRGIADLPPGWSATRVSVGGPWRRYPTSTAIDDQA